MNQIAQTTFVSQTELHILSCVCRASIYALVYLLLTITISYV